MLLRFAGIIVIFLSYFKSWSCSNLHFTTGLFNSKDNYDILSCIRCDSITDIYRIYSVRCHEGSGRRSGRNRCVCISKRYGKSCISKNVYSYVFTVSTGKVNFKSCAV